MGQRQAASWEEKAVASLAEFEGPDDPEDFDWTTGRHWRNYILVEYGHMEWSVFKNFDAAERAAEEYIQDMLDTEGIGMFKKEFVQNFLYVSDTDKRIIGQEEAESYWDMPDEEEVIEYHPELDMKAWNKIVERIEELEGRDQELEEEDWDLDQEFDAIDTDSLSMEEVKAEIKRIRDLQAEIAKKREKVEKERFKLDTEDKEKAFEDLLEALKSNHAERVEQEIEDDLLGWLEELGYELSGDLPSFVQVDEKKLIADAIRVDGVAHFLSHYDGEQMELAGDAVAYRTN